MLADEMQQPLRWIYMSFARPKSLGGFLGGLWIKARGQTHAMILSHQEHLNPGDCEVHFAEVEGIEIPNKWANRLLSVTELKEMDTDMGGSGEVERF